MLFDPRPKEYKNELFDSDKELDALRRVTNSPLTLVLGVRRMVRLLS